MKNGFKRSISGLLAAVLAFQPMLVRAGEIVHVRPDTARPRVDRAHNGTTILNIDTPNAAGVSHDQYRKFSAGDLILNNSPTNVTTELGGWIEGNPNLKPANPAKLWIGEVVGGSAAELNGMLEVGGPTMDVVLANEYGITCSGCGFINTGRATLTTGAPALNAAGGLDRFDVRQGTVTITGAGLNPESRVGASDTGRVDVIARAAAIYGRMRAKGLNVVSGANAVKYDWSYDPATGKVTGVAPQDGIGAAPALAVDVSALGGMYADAIQMIATERGVGVRIDGEMASGSSLSLSSAGRLSLGSSSGVGLKARQKVIVRSDGPLLLEGSVTSEQGDLVDIRTGGALTFTGQASGGNILLESAGAANVAAAVAARGKLTLRSTGSSLAVGADAALSARSAVLTAGGNLTLKGSLDAGGAVELAAGETLEAGAGAKVSAGSLRLGGTAVATAGLLKAAGALAVTAGSGGLANNGELSGESVAIASTGNASNSGAILAARDLRIESLDSIANSGSLAGASATFVATRDTANSGTIAAAGALDISAGFRLSATAGSKISGGTVALSGGTVETAGTIVANAALTIEAAAGGLSNRGTVQAATTGIRSAAALLNEGQIGGRDEVAIAAAADLGNEGVISSLGTVRLQSGATMALGKNSETSGGNVALSAAALHSAGTVVADAALTIAAGGGGIGNSGLLAGETVNATAKGQLANSGAISGRSAVSLGAAASLLVSGSITSEGTIGLSAEQTLSTMAAAEIAGQSVALTGGSVRSAGTVVADAALEIVSASGGIVNSGTLVGARAVAGTGGSFRNEGAVAGSTELLIAATDIRNSGVLSSNGLVLLKAARSVVTDDGSRVAGGAVDVSGESLATAGVILAETTLRLASGSGGTASSATISASTAELVSTGEVGNAGVVEGIDKVIIGAAAVTNDGTLLSRGRVGIDADRTVATGRGSGIQAGAVAIDAASVATAGTIVADRTLEIVADSGGIGNSGTLIGGSARFETTAAFRNDGRIVGAQDLFAAAENITNSGVLAGDGAIRLDAGKTLTTTADARIDGGAVDLAAERILSAGTTLADTGLNVSAGTGGLFNSGSLVSSSTTLASGAAIDNQGNIEGTSALTIAAATVFAATEDSSIRAGDAAISADAVDIAGKLAATGLLAVNAGSGGLKSSGTLSGGSIDLVSAGTFANTGLVSGGDTLTIAAAAPFINAAALVSGRDLAIYNDQILNNGGVIWANGSITLAANAALDPADVVQNTDGRIEALQGDLTIRANEVYNVGTAPTIGSSQIIKWLEKGSAGTTEPAEEILKLIDPAYLDADGNIKPSHAGAYAALWADLVSGGSLLSATSRSIVKPSVTTPSGTALAAAFAGIWPDMLARANAAGTPDPAAAIKELVSDTAFASNGDILPQNAAAYAALWDTLASGGTTVTDDVKAILKPTSLEVEGTGTDPATGETATVYSNRLVAAATSPWNAMTAGSGAAYDIVKILYQDRFQDDGVLAELVAGGSIDIKAGKVENIYGNISAAENIVITADDVKNQALGASQFLVEVHKRPDCFTCHEGKVEFYDTFGGRIEANGTVAISGNLENVTLPSSELSTKDVLDKLNAYIAERQAAGDPDMAGVPPASDKNFELTETRTDDYTAPVAGNGSEVRKVEGTDLGSETKVDTGPPAKFDPLSPIAVNRYGPVVVDPLAPVAVDRPAPASVALPGTPTVIPVDTAVLSEKLLPVVPLRPSLSPTASVDALLVAGLTTLAETDPEFTQYANFVTSDYLMSEGRLAYRDDLVNNGRETILAALKRAGERVPVPAFDYLDKPVQVPAPDGSGSRTVYPKAVPLSLDATGALIQGRDVAIASGSLTSSGTIAGSRSLTVSAGTVSVDSGRLIAESGALTLSALDAASFENATISGGSVALVTGGELLAAGTSIVSAGDLSIYGNAGVTLTGLERSFAGTWANGTFETVDQQLSTLQSGGDLAIVSGGALTLAGVTGDAAGALSLAAAGDLVLSAVESTTAFQRSGRRSSLDISTVASSATKLNAGGDLSALAGGSAVLVGTALDSGGSIRLAAKDEVVLAAAQDIYSYDAKTQKKSLFKKKSTSVSKARVTNEGVSIAAAGDVDVIAETGDFVTAGSRFVSAGGDIGLSATEGDIYAGAYTDIFQESRTTKKSYFFGLFGSTTNSSAESRFSTGTDALAALDLTLVSGADTTLVGAHLAAGGNLSVDTGGDFKVEAAIDSERKAFFSNNLGLVTMTTITERSFRETAKLSSFEAGGAVDFSIGGQANLSLYNQAGVDPANPGDLYPEELLAIAGLAFIEAGLANEYFYDKQVALSPAFKALVAVAVANFVAPAIVGTVLPGLSGWAVAAAEAFTSSFIVESLDGIVSGNYDIGEILKGAAFSGATAGLKDAVNLSALGIDTEGLLNESLLGGFGNGQLTLGGILDGALDGAIGSGLTSLVYGTDFGSGFSQALLSTVVNLALADVQGGIGDLGLGEGTLPSALLHGLAGCAAAEAQGGNCAAGAAGAVAQSFFAGSLKGTTLSDQEQRDRAELIGAVAGYLLSGGDADNVNLAAAIAVSALTNNRQLHRTEVEWINENAGAFISWMCRMKNVCDLTREQALGILAAETLDGVSDAFGVYGGPGRRANYKDEARAFIAQSYVGPIYVDGQTMFGQLDSGSSEYRNTLLNAETALSNLALYDYATAQSAWPQDYTAAMSFLHEALNDFADVPTSIEAQAFVAALSSSPDRTRSIFAAYGASNIRAAEPTIAAAYGIKKLLAALPSESRSAAAIGFAEGTTGRTGLTPEEVENAVLNGTWGPVAGVALEEALFGDLLTRGMTVVALSSGRRVLQDPDGKQYDTVAEARQAVEAPEGGLPTGYSRNADGTISGPRGGSYTVAGTDLDGQQVYRDTSGRYYTLVGGRKAQVPNPSTNPNVSITRKYKHHQEYVNDVSAQLSSQGYTVENDVTFGSLCKTGSCKPDIVYRRPGETQVSGIIEIKTGNGPNTSSQMSIFPQISSGDAVPSGPVAERLRLIPNVPLRDQGYPNGIPVFQISAPGL